MTDPNAPFLSRERIVAPPGYNRWLVPPAALAIHLCIGMAYGFSVFWLPLSKALAGADQSACPKDPTFISQILATSCDWKISTLGWMYTLFFVFLGSAAALWGGWLERVGPRKAGVVAAVCWSGGLVIAALGVYTHQILLMWLGSGVIGGVGLGLGYISPVSTLMKWFPDRRGMATGMAIMGFGGGAMIGAPLADKLMKFYATPTDVGVWQTFLTMAALYFVFMMGGALGYRVPRQGWLPAGFTPATSHSAALGEHEVHLDVATFTPQFWLVWAVLCLNVTAGIGIIGMASPMLQEVFAGRLIGIAATFNDLTAAQKGQVAAIGAAFAGLLSLFNIAGRFVWASASDYFGRRATYYIFFLLGIALYASGPWAAKSGQLALFVLFFGVILSMYGGGFATVPAYLADLFGTSMVGAIHGRLLTAWSAAGIFGPVLVNYIREYQIEHGVAKADAYSITMYVLAGLLAIGCLCNALIKPVEPRLYYKPAPGAAPAATGTGEAAAASAPLLVGAWLAVLAPLAWGLWVTLTKAAVLFR
jgi:MFS family permease